MKLLWIYGTNVADLSPLRDHTSLESLWLSSTQVSNLLPIRNLNSLIKGARHHVTKGLVFRDCAACRIDPDGLGMLAKIDDDEERTRKTLDYLQSLTDWPPVNADPIEAAMHGPILEASLADIALIESHFEPISPDPPQPRERDKDYSDLIALLAHAAGQIARLNRVDQLGPALVGDFAFYERQVTLDQPNGRMLDYTADSIRGALADDYLTAALDGRDLARIGSFVRAHDELMRGWFPRAFAMITLKADLPADALLEGLPPRLSEGETIVKLGINLGIFSFSVEVPLAQVKGHMDSAIRTLRISDDPARHASALSDLRKTATLLTAYLGRIKGRLQQFVLHQTRNMRADPGKAAQDVALSVAAAERILAAIGPVFDDLWRWISHLPLPF